MHWLRPEFTRGLTRARALVEQYVEEQTSAVALREAVTAVEEISSSARIVQCAGVAIAAAEIAEALDALAREEVEDVPALATAAVSALMQLDDYADAVVGGLPDHVLVLHPALNDLRVAQGLPLLSESELFARQLSQSGLDRDYAGPEAGAPSAQAIARKYESTFQQALAQWLRGEARESIARIGKLSEAFARGADDGAMHLLWRCMAATAECALAGGIDASLDLRRLLGRSVPAVRALAAGQPFAEAESLAGALLWHLGRAQSAGARTRRLRDELALERHLPDENVLARMRARLRGTNSALIAQLSQELRSDLGKVKDHIDLRVRAGAGDMDEARQLLDQMAHTLSMLGLPALARVARNQMSLLSTLLSEAADATHEGWIDIASALLRIDISLDEALYRQLSSTVAGDDSQPLGEEIPNAADLQGGEQALVRESQVNISRVKTAVDGWLRSGSTEGLFEGPAQLQQVSSALDVISHRRFAGLVASLAELASEHGLQGICEDPARAERFADAIAVVDFYLESLLQRNTPGAHLIETLSGLLDGLAPATIAEEEGEAPREAVAAHAAPEPQPEAEPDPASEEEVDPDIRAVFLEEADEVQAAIEVAYARWQRDPEDAEAMLEVRRGFHTLKGSGRMVGASALGEFAWACESLLNACRDGGLAVTPAIVSFTGEAVAFVPDMVRAFAERGEIADPRRLSELSERAERLRQGGATDAERDELLATFYEDAAAQLGLAARWLQQQAVGKQVEDSVLRAFHTLRGSSAAVGFEGFSAVTGDAEHYLNALRRAERRVEADTAETLAGIVSALRERVNARDAEPEAAQLAQWRETLGGLHEALPESERDDAESHAISDAFAMEALDWLKAVDEQLLAWRDDPAARHYAPAMRDQLRNLAGTAANSGCAALAEPARAFVERLEVAVAEGRAPSPAALEAAQAHLEALFQQLDAFREGSAAEDPAALAARIATLDWQASGLAPPPALPEDASAPPDVAMAGPAPAEASNADATYDSDADAAELRELFIGEASELLEAIDSALDRLERGAQPGEALRELARALHTFKGSARMAGFDEMGEVAHRCETLAARIEEGAASADTLSLSRLHNAADGLYRAVEQLRAGGTPDVSGLLADSEELVGEAAPAASPASSGLEGAGAPAGEPPEPSAGTAHRLDAEGGLDELADELPHHPAMEGQALPVEEEPEADAALDEPLEVPVWHPSAEQGESSLPWSDSEEEAAAGPARVSEALPETSVPKTPAVGEEPSSDDAELRADFSQEAAKLLETIQSALERWTQDAERGVPVDEAGSVIDLRRALHTLKGSVRMADAVSVAAVAHEMESMVDDLLAGQMEPDSATFMQLQTRLEQLQYLQDSGVRPSPEEGAVTWASSQGDDSAYFDDRYIDELTAAAPEPPAEEAAAGRAVGTDSQWDPRVLWKPPTEDESLLGLKRELARVPVPDLESLLNQAGEISVLRARLDEQNAGISGQLDELSETVNRLRDQLRQLNAETEAQIEARGLAPGGEAQPDRYAGDFDPLEMDRYSRMQELSRALAETVGDINVLQDAMRTGSSESEALLLQQQRINSDLQQGLMGTLMVPFARQTQRLQRVVRQTAQEMGKQVSARFEGETIEVDRNVLERMTAPLEHALRNAVIHGIEDTATRRSRGKAEAGAVAVSLGRDGRQLRLTVADDGGGLDFEAIRRGAIERGLMHEQAELSQAQLALFILEPGFSTARELTQSAGRGVGMDVLAAEVRQLGGSLEIDSKAGEGTRFIIHLPITLGLTQALMFVAGEERFAVPLTAIEGVARVPRAQAMPADGSQGRLQYGDREYRVAFAADYLGLPRAPATDARALPAILLRLPEGVDEGARELALVVDQVIGNREVVSKTIGPVLAAVPGMTGATILPDGRIVLLLDLPSLIQDRIRRQRIREAPEPIASTRPQKPSIMVVDDSITMRRVAERLLERNGYEVQLARDGVDAMGQLATLRPDVVLLDIEMPRADGFEVASYMRNSTHLEATPIIMITSRSGDKHRERAAELGVQRYLIKPYQEKELLAEINAVRAEAAA